jgi:hypothetical protein
MATHNKRHQLKTGLLVTGLLSLAALMILIATGIERVNTSRAQDVWRSLWLVEFNWLAALILLIVAVAGLLGGFGLRDRS